MTFRFLVITLTTYPLIIFAEKPQDSPPFCSKANVPFVNEEDAFAYAKHAEECRSEYWKETDNPYHGMNGYKKVFGDLGYMFNKSTIFEFDGVPIHGYMHGRAKAVVSQSLISYREAFEPELITWDKYEVYYHVNMSVVLSSVGAELVESYRRITWFEDDSGIVSYTTTGSESSIFGGVVRGLISTTEVIFERLGYLDDDIDYTNNYIQNPIQFIFICVFCALTVFVAVCVYMTLKCTLSGNNRRLKIVNINSISNQFCDDSQELHQWKN
eukprot:230916_1